jgi:hypothetical protein
MVNSADNVDLLANETKDLFSVKQLVLVLGVFTKTKLGEDFLQFEPLTNFMGQGLAETS